MNNSDESPINGQADASVSVGYGRPPEDTRFKKGVSGNPKGRPKGSQNLATVFVKTLKEKVVINEHGQRKTVSKLEAAIKQLVNKAASGDLRALQLLVNFSREAENRDLSMPEKPSVLREVDQKVLAGIFRRFQNGSEHQGAGHE
jgi:hypothetical protein